MLNKAPRIDNMGAMEAKLHVSLTLVPDGSEWSYSRPGRFIIRERAYHWVGSVGPRVIKNPCPARFAPTILPVPLERFHTKGPHKCHTYYNTAKTKNIRATLTILSVQKTSGTYRPGEVKRESDGVGKPVVLRGTN